MATIKSVKNATIVTGIAFIEGVETTGPAGEVDQYLSLTVEGRMFDALAGPSKVIPGTRDCWLKTLVDPKMGYQIEIRTFDPPEEGVERQITNGEVK